MDFVPYILSILAFASSVGSTMVKGNTKKQLGFMLALSFFSNFFAAMGYLFNSAGINGFASACLGCVLTIINYIFRFKNMEIPKTVLGSYYIGFFVINIINKNTLFLTIIAILATFSYVINLAQKDGKGFRVWKLINNFLWLIYDGTSKSYNQVLLRCMIIIFTLMSSWYFDIKKEKTENEV